MEVPDKVGWALPFPENATSERAWKFTTDFEQNNNLSGPTGPISGLNTSRR